jgi:hypothetical protein
MSFQDIVKQMRDLLAHISIDLEKAFNGNKAASQRVRVGTIKLEKAAKRYRKESVKMEKNIVKRGKKAPKAKVKAKAKRR